MIQDEKSFQRWYKGHATKLGINPDPDDPRQFYDYRKAYHEGVKPDESGHWPSKYKLMGHPTYHYKEEKERTVPGKGDHSTAQPL